MTMNITIQTKWKIWNRNGNNVIKYKSIVLTLEPVEVYRLRVGKNIRLVQDKNVLNINYEFHFNSTYLEN